MHRSIRGKGIILRIAELSRRGFIQVGVGLFPIPMLGAEVFSAVADGVVIEPGEYEGREQLVIRTPAMTWYYDCGGGGFSRLLDREGRDWIAFCRIPLSEFPASAAAGYRGLPNLLYGKQNPDAGGGHPGFDVCRTEKVAQNRLVSETNSGRWCWSWVFEENFATFEMLRADPQQRWWFLYEGPIAGTYEPTQKYWGTDKGGPSYQVPSIQNQLFDHWRWIYFGDRRVGRVLFLVQHQKDDLLDTLWFMGNTGGGAVDSPDGMVVFGFGRGPNTRPLLQGSGHRFTVGFLEEGVNSPEDHLRVANRIESFLLSHSR